MGRKDDLKKRLEEFKKNANNPEMWAAIFSYVGKGAAGLKKKNQVPFFIRLVVPFLIVYQAFFPFVVWQFSLTFLGIFVLGIILIGVAVYFIGGALLSSLNIILDIMIPIFVVVFLSFLTMTIGSPNYYKVLGVKYGSLTAGLSFLGLIIVGMVLIAVKSPPGFTVASVFFAIFVFLILPYVLAVANVSGICLKIPIPYLSQYCHTTEVYVEPMKTVKIQVGGGIELTLETSKNLYAGSSYEFGFNIKNDYDGPITFKLTPVLASSYGKNLEGKNLEFTQKFDQQKDVLSPNENYPGSFLMDPTKMEVKEAFLCPYHASQIVSANKVQLKDVKCADDKPCGDSNMMCVETGNYECKCADWTVATCSKSPVTVKMYVDHSGFFIGNASLYYAEKTAPQQPAAEITQGPLHVIIEFQPNPYIATINQYREDISMRVGFRNLGGDMTIKDFKVEPQNTIIHKIDPKNGVELVEEVGTQIISCKSIEEIIPSGFLPSGKETSGVLCKLTPPSVKATLKDLNKDQVIETDNIRTDKISDYCNQVKTETFNENGGSTTWSSNWNNLFNTIGDSGLCQIEKTGGTQEKATIESSLAHVDVIVEFTYERNAVFTSSDISPITRVTECCNLDPTQC